MWAPMKDSNGKPRVWFAGEACCLAQYGYTHGALQSGKEVAAKFLYKNGLGPNPVNQADLDLCSPYPVAPWSEAFTRIVWVPTLPIRPIWISAALIQLHRVWKTCLSTIRMSSVPSLTQGAFMSWSSFELNQNPVLYMLAFIDVFIILV